MSAGDPLGLRFQDSDVTAGRYLVHSPALLIRLEEGWLNHSQRKI